MDYSLLGSSVHGIHQVRILEWVPFPPPGDLPDPGIEPLYPKAPALAADSLPLSHLGSLIVHLGSYISRPSALAGEGDEHIL